MDKLAKTKDPRRQALRVKKNEWNKSTKKFISDFIALKKGINGTGDSKHGIPPVAIDEPFPGQVGSFLNELANSAAKIIEEAKAISKDQDSYAVSLNKKASTEAELIKLAELISYASWWGSRFLSRFKLTGPQKKYVINMMYSLVDMSDKLKTFESELLTLNRVKIPDSFTTLNIIIKKYLAAYVDSLNGISQFLPENLKPQLQDANRKIRELNKKKSKETLDKTVIEEGDDKEPSAEEPARKEKISPLELLLRINPEINELTGDFQSAEIIVNAILHHSDTYTIDGSLRNSLERDLDQYRKYHDLFVYELRDENAPTRTRLTSTQILNDKNSFKRLYDKLRKDINKVKINRPYSDESGFGAFGEGKTPISQLKDVTNNSSFNELLFKLQEVLPDQSGFSQASDLLYYSMIKEASFQNWLRSQYIGLNLDPIKVPDSFDIVQLNIYETSKVIRKEIQIILNKLEKPDTSIAEIFEVSKQLNKYLIQIISNMIKLGGIYSSFLRRKDRSKDQYKIDIKYSDLNELNNLKNILENIKFINYNSTETSVDGYE